ncbi:UNVERIFIED_CONTAM: hypothetical protein NCL1_29759 [Trichonephila clavipes]
MVGVPVSLQLANLVLSSSTTKTRLLFICREKVSRFPYPHVRAGWRFLSQCSCKVEALSAFTTNNKSILADDEDNSVLMPLAKRSKRYNPHAIHAMAFVLEILG